MSRTALLAAALLLGSGHALAHDSSLTILAGRVLNVETGAYDSNVVVTIRGGMIADMRKAIGGASGENTIDPLGDVRTVERVEFVMKAGRVYLSPGR